MATADTGKCCLLSCRLGPLDRDMGRVEVKAFEVPATKREGMCVDWSLDGEATFHRECWSILVRSLKEGKPLNLNRRDRDMVTEAKKTAEYFDSMAQLEEEAAHIARLLKQTKHAIAFTGAGISTSAGIGDFRGKSGKWTENDRKKTHGYEASKAKKSGFSYISLRPTYTHEALCKLVELGYLKHIISQNTDGLHRLSGVPRERISELHGNSFHEKCEVCETRYERPFACRTKPNSTAVPRACPECRINHRTGGVCERPGCGGFLMNTIINFGDCLEDEVLSCAMDHGKLNDLVLCLGSSLRVTPACDIIEMGKQPPRIVICNRQPTPFDELCAAQDEEGGGRLGSRVFGDCDGLMRAVMRSLLSPDDLRDWEEAREDRMREFDKQRVAHR